MPTIKIKNNGVWETIGGTPDISTISANDIGALTIDLNNPEYGTPPALLGAIRLDFNAELPASGWSDTAPYTQTIEVMGISITDRPIIAQDLTGATAETIDELEKNYSYIKEYDTSLNAITFTCIKNKPEIDLAIQGQAMRGGSLDFESAVGVEF